MRGVEEDVANDIVDKRDDKHEEYCDDNNVNENIQDDDGTSN